jgi:hypothetical protein
MKDTLNDLWLNFIVVQVRFPLMTVKEFAKGPAQSGVLTDK